MVTQPSAADFASIPTVWRPRASPSGEKVAFFRNPDGRFELHVCEIESGDHRQLTDGELHRSPNAPFSQVRD